MSDLLEPFRRAAELGSLDFSISGNGNVYFASTEYERDDYSSYPLPYTGPIKSKVLRINRYAAAVCAEWWHRQIDDAVRPVVDDFSTAREWTDAVVKQREFLEECHRMIDLCREFGRKHGGNA